MSGVVRLEGESVTMSGTGDLGAARGRFRLHNPGPDRVHAAVVEAWLDVGDRRRPVAPATVFDADHDRAHDPAGFDVDAGTMTFLLGFPRVADESGPGESTSVGLRLEVDGATVEARSPIVFERRIPRRS